MRKIYFTFLAMSLLSMLGYAQPVGWNYSRRIDVTENSGATLTNYQLKMYVNTQAEIAAGHMLASGDDIRFGQDCNGSTLLNHWIEGPMNDDSTIIWVKIPTLAANATTSIYMFFGNSSATSTSAVQGTFIGPHSATDSVASGGAGGATSSQRGFRFAPTQDILVASFGKREPNGSTRYVTLFNYTTQAILRQTQVSGPAAQYSYAALPQPIWLTTGTQYLLQLYQGASDGYYFGTSSQIGQHLQYFDMRYCNSCTQNTFPTSTLSNYHYGYPDLWYYTRQNVTPAPSYIISNQGAISVVASDITDCEGVQVTLGGTYVGGSAPYTCHWTSSPSISDTSSCTPTVIVGQGSYYIFTVTDGIGCRGMDTAFVMNGTPSLSLTYDSTVVCAGDTVSLMASGTGDYYIWSPADSLSSIIGSTVMAWPGFTTSYLCTATDSNSGCQQVDTATVNVRTIVLSVLLGPIPMCDGDSVALTVSGADTYTWSPATGLSDTTGSVVIAAPDSSTTYTIVGTDTTYGCTAEFEAAYEVLVFPNPTVTFDLQAPYCAGGADAPLTTGTPSGGVYSGQFVNNNMFTASSATAGTYVLTYLYTDVNGCEGSDTALAVVQICPGTTPGQNITLGVYPNPSAGIFTMVLGESAELVQYQVTNLVGQVLRSGDLQAGATMLDLQDQPSGFYFLTVQTGGARKTISLEVKR